MSCIFHYRSPDLAHVPHGFFTSRGGVSSPPYARLNCGYNTGDDKENIEENITRVARQFHARRKAISWVRQIHSNKILTISEPVFGIAADGLITDNPHLFVAVTTADCIPLLLSNEEGSIVGAIHAGWRGIQRGIIQQAVTAMRRKGVRAQALSAVIGPCISKRHYEIGQDMITQLLSVDPKVGAFITENADKKNFFDLRAWCISTLRACGFTRCTSLDIDTYEPMSHCFSYRRAYHHNQRDTGRQISLIAPKAPL